MCVTGASGNIASWLVKLLLQLGYTVNASVRDLDDPTKTERLLALDGAKERLHLFKADFLEEGSFDSMVDGCEGVFHTTPPFCHTVSNPQVELIDPAVKGALNVLRSCAKVPSIKRVVVTSSMAAVAFTGKTLTLDVVVNETWFSDPAVCVKLKLGLFDAGTQTFPNTTYRGVDVRDAANAHIQAFEVPSANGRYCLVSRVAQCSEVVKILHELYPTSSLPDKIPSMMGCLTSLST